MGFHQTPPGEGSQGSGVHFSYMGTKNNAKWHAFCAGPCVWLECHPHKKTKPCCDKITRGELLCPFCGSMPPAKTMGFLPVWREVDYRPGCVVLYENQRELVDRFELHERIMMGRESEQSDGTWVARALSPGKRFETTSLVKKLRHDICPSLLRMWKIPTLNAWWEVSEKKRSDSPLSLPAGIAVRDSGEPFGPMHQGAAKRFGADVLPADEGDAEAAQQREYLRSVQAGKAKPSTNGTHKSKPKG